MKSRLSFCLLEIQPDSSIVLSLAGTLIIYVLNWGTCNLAFGLTDQRAVRYGGQLRAGKCGHSLWIFH